MVTYYCAIVIPRGICSSFENIAWVAAQKKLVVSINIAGECSSFTVKTNLLRPTRLPQTNSMNVTGVVAA
jgi:hypothetical protein